MAFTPPRTRFLLALGLAFSLPVQAFTIDAIGDSITWGVTRSGAPPERDPEGGYPGRLAQELGGGVRVVNRGIGGSATTDWLGDASRNSAGLRHALVGIWPDFAPRRDPAPRERFVDWVLATDQPDVVVMLIGVNDISRIHGTGAPIIARTIARRIVKLAHRARAVAPRVVIGTLLPNRRDPPDAVDAVNTELCALEPDCVRVERAFDAAGGLALLGDEVHPAPRGYGVIARAFAEALRDEHRAHHRRARPPAN